MPPTGPPGGDALSPLPPPPRAQRRNRWEEGDPLADGVPPELGRAPRDEWDAAPREEGAADDEWGRPRRGERDEPDW